MKAPWSPGLGAAESAVFEVYAVSYGVLEGFAVRDLVAGADPARTVDLQMMVWLLRGPAGRTVLVDTGFYRAELFERWSVRDYVRPSEALEPLGLRPSEVTDVIVTHAHWDHAGGVALFPQAHVWLQREEYNHYREPRHRVDSGVLTEDMAALEAVEAAGRLHLVDGDDQPLVPGVVAFTGGRHTRASQYVAVASAAGAVVLASDDAYLYENLEDNRPIAQTWDPASNLAAHARMRRLAARPGLIVPGHDPRVFERFPGAGRGAVRIA